MNRLLKMCSFIFLLSLASCLPDRVNETSLDGNPVAPDFTITEVPGNSNKLVLTDVSSNNFQRLWSLSGGLPKSSNRLSDTVLYAKAGIYKITLLGSNSDGSGTATTSKTVTIAQDAALSCSPKLALLTGDCLPAGKCWTMSKVAAAVRVGPTYDDYSWFTSPVNGLQNEQYDDKFCFTFEGLKYQNKNNGASVNPWNQYKAEAYDPGISDFLYLEGTGINNRDQIILQDNQFMGLWDSDNAIDIVKLTKDELVVRMRLRAQNGVPNPEGWFELTFVAN
ncbi:MAG: PKD domain-containing protein [Saprospiraceae bacterium]|nr:PKD domain-containing protein [Saprospiraceae bacterium]